MPIDSSVAELLTAQLFVLVQEAPDPIYFYINSTGIAVCRSSLAAASQQEQLQQCHWIAKVAPAEHWQQQWKHGQGGFVCDPVGVDHPQNKKISSMCNCYRCCCNDAWLGAE